MGKSKFQISRSLDERIKRIVSGSFEQDSEFTQTSSAYILGFNYGNLTNCIGLTTNYQLHHAVFPVVGLAFFKTSPTDDDIKSNLKKVKEYSSSPNGLGSFKSDKNEHLFLIYSVDNDTNKIEKRIFNITKGTFVHRRGLRLNVLNDPYLPKNYYNGADDNQFNLDNDSMTSSDDDQIDHLIFFIHGVGGVCDVRFRSCVEVVADFKKMANSLLAQQSNPSSGASTPTTNTSNISQHFKKGFFRKQSSESTASSRTDSDQIDANEPRPASRSRVRKVECLPISWHSLTRRQTGISDQLNLIALSSVPKLRHFLNKVVMDALLYSSGPIYTQIIMNNVGNEINRLYSLFMEKHPNFTGSVSLAGHSLGSVIIFDLLAHQISSDQNVQQAEAKTKEYLDGQNHETKTSSLYNNNNNTITKLICNHIDHSHSVKCSVDCSHSNSCSHYENLEELLKDMNLSQYAELFHREHIDLNSLLLLTDYDMKELRLSLGARRKLGSYINFKKASQISRFLSDQQIDGRESTRTTDSRKVSELVFANLFANMNTGQMAIQYPQLKFKPRCFFAFGSPMPMFLNVRGIQNLSKEYKLPTCDRVYNIFHPYDPLAYRIEPLLDPRYKTVEPVLVAHHRGGKRIHVQIREGFARVGHDIKHRLLGSLRNTWSSFTRFNAPDVTPSDESSSDSNNQPNSPGESNVKDERRLRLTKSVSSSVDVEIGSLDSHLSGLGKNTTPLPGSGSSASKKRRRQLKKQQSLVSTPGQLVDSSPVTPAAPSAASLSSIIENSMRDTSETTEEESESDDGQLGESTTVSSPKNENPLSENQSGQSTSVNQSQQQGAKSTSSIKMKKTKKQKAKNLEYDPNDVADGELDLKNVGCLNGGRRIDYVLQEKPIELFNEYLFAFTSHANYWQNEDSAMMVLNEIYQIDNIQLFDQT